MGGRVYPGYVFWDLMHTAVYCFEIHTQHGFKPYHMKLYMALSLFHANYTIYERWSAGKTLSSFQWKQLINPQQHTASLKDSLTIEISKEVASAFDSTNLKQYQLIISYMCNNLVVVAWIFWKPYKSCRVWLCQVTLQVATLFSDKKFESWSLQYVALCIVPLAL